MTVAYLGHRYWSFSHRAHTGLPREYLLFAVVNGVTLVLGLAIVAFVRYPLGQESALVLQVANVASIGLGTVIRYLSYRRWVFPARRPDAGRPGRRGRQPAGPRLRRAGPRRSADRSDTTSLIGRPRHRVGPAVAKSSAFVTRPSQESTSTPGHEEAVRTTTSSRDRAVTFAGLSRPSGAPCQAQAPPSMSSPSVSRPSASRKSAPSRRCSAPAGSPARGRPASASRRRSPGPPERGTPCRSNNCTAALHLARLRARAGPGDEVVVADYTFPATGHAVM